MSIQVENNLKNSENKEIFEQKAHYIPCHIEEDGPANVKNYFEPYVVENGSKGLSASFRGHPIDGVQMPLPEGYRGVIVAEGKRPLSEDAERKFQVIGGFKDITYWNWDKTPSSNDNLAKSMVWMDIAEVMHFQYQIKVEPLDITNTPCTTFLTPGDVTTLQTNEDLVTPVYTKNLNTCVHCGRSVLRRRFHTLNTGSEREIGVFNIICQWISPLKAELSTSRICHPCWIKADKASQEDLGQAPKTSKQPAKAQESQSTDGIALPNYCRASQTASKCFVKGCQNTDRIRVPDFMRKRIFHKYNYYIPQNNRLCNRHIKDERWVQQSKEVGNCLNVFTAVHIQDMLLLK